MDYGVTKEILSFREIVEHFHENEIGPDNLLILSTGGYHGTAKTLDDCERILKNEDQDWTPAGAYVTVLIVQPSKVSMMWGEVRLRTLNEVSYLRQKMKETRDSLLIGQEGNV